MVLALLLHACVVGDRSTTLPSDVPTRLRAPFESRPEAVGTPGTVGTPTAAAQDTGPGGAPVSPTGAPTPVPTIPPTTPSELPPTPTERPDVASGGDTHEDVDPSVTSPSPDTGGDPRHAEGTVDDRRGDVATTPTTPAPPGHVDLVGARLRRTPAGFELVFVLATAPPARQADVYTNLASFHDVDGDGVTDHEVWASLGPSGWGTAHYDEVRGEARFGDEDDVAVTARGVEVVLTFPAEHLGDVRSMQWAVASEHGPAEHLGTALASRDAAPDDHGVRWPG